MSNLPNVKQNPQFARYRAESPQNPTIGVSSRSLYRYPRRTRTAVTPMTMIELEGHALSRMSHGSVSWWVAIACWFTYGLLMSFILGPSLGYLFQLLGHLIAFVGSEPLSGTGWINLLWMSLITLFLILVGGALLIILVRGTLYKFRHRRPRR